MGLEKTVLDLWHYGWPKFRAEGFRGLLHALKRRVAPAATAPDADLPSALFHGFVPKESLQNLFRRSEVNLGFTRIVGERLDAPGRTQIKLRDFEVPLAGGFYLVERVPEYGEMFEFGREVETWSRPEELVEKVRYYLDHTSEREEIAAAGKRRAEADHTWSKRFEALFEDLGIG